MSVAITSIMSTCCINSVQIKRKNMSVSVSKVALSSERCKSQHIFFFQILIAKEETKLIKQVVKHISEFIAEETFTEATCEI